MGERLRPPACDLELEVSARVAPLSADEDALVTVMVNLLDNACKYTPGPRKISVSASGSGERVILSVKDNGIGIAPREHRRIFRRFYQVDQRLARETGGCGLGLSRVRIPPWAPCRTPPLPKPPRGRGPIPVAFPGAPGAPLSPPEN